MSKPPREGRTDIPPALVCAVCRRPIEQTVGYDADDRPFITSYEHPVMVPGVPEHDPVPVLLQDLADQVSVCDLCGSPAPSWQFPVKDFVIDFGTEYNYYHSVEDWYLCEDCATDVLAGDAEGPVRRWRRNHRPVKSRAVRLVRQMHKGFRDYRSGPPFRIGTQINERS